jgi:hypothetical protein
MTEDAAGVLAWAQRASITTEEAWKKMQDVNEDVDWDVEQMLEASSESQPEASQ